MSKINLDRLPAELRELVRVLGESAAFKLVERRGGGRLIVPKKVHPDHRLMDELGLKAFADLVAHYGSEVLELPKYDSVTRQLRHQRVRRLRVEGRTHDRIAIETGYTRRQVINILAADDDLVPSSQLDLFGAPLLISEEEADGADQAPAPAPHSANDPFNLGRKIAR